jgi:NTE family protein
MGALVGAAHVSGALDRLETFARSITRVTMMRLIDINPTTGGLIEGRLVEARLRALGYAGDVKDTDRPFAAVASDLFGAAELWLREGDLVDAVRASIAIPGIFSPVSIGGRWLLDGGMTNPVPVSACRALGADIVIAVDPNSKMHAYRHRLRNRKPALDTEEAAGLLDMAPAALRPYVKSVLDRPQRKTVGLGYFSVLATSIDLMTDQIRRSRLAGDPPHLIVSPDLSRQSILEFYRADQAIAEGRRAMTSQLPALRDLLEISTDLL